MEIRSSDSLYLDWTGNALALGFFQDEVAVTGDLAQLDEKLAGTLQELISEEEFTGKANTSVVSRVGGNKQIRKLILVGLGKIEEFTENSLRLAAATIAPIAGSSTSLAINFPLFQDNPTATAGAITEGIFLALHEDNRFKSEAPENGTKLAIVELLGLGGTEAAIARAEKICSGGT